MSDTLLAREAELHRRNADIDAAVASARIRLLAAEAPATPPRQVAGRDDSFVSAASPVRQSGLTEPLSPSVRAVAAASAARRSESSARGGFGVASSSQRPSSSKIPKPGSFPRDVVGSSDTDTVPATLLEDVDPALPSEIQLHMLRSQLKIARKMSLFC